MIKENKKQIVFYCASHPFEVIYKIARIFRKKGYETILFTMCEKDRFDYEFYSEAFDKVICSNFQFFKPSLRSIPYILKRGASLIKFLISVKLIKPYVVIGVSGNNWQLRLVHKYFLRKYPFIYFPYDIISHSYNSIEEALEKGTKKFEIEAEKYCFENAEGVMHKGDPNELKFVEGRIHKKLKVQELQLSFLPYCSKEFTVPLNNHKLSQKDKELHLVYVGGFRHDYKSKKKAEDIVNNIQKQKINVHIYTKEAHLSEKNEKKHIQNFFSPFIKKKYFHLHKALDPKELIPEISKYDFGFWINHAMENLESKFATGNKIASYFEAGLPFIYDDQLLFVDKLMKSYGLVGLSFNEKNVIMLKKRLRKLNYKKILKKVQKARIDFGIDKNFPRLERFIEKVVRKREPQ